MANPSTSRRGTADSVPQKEPVTASAVMISVSLVVAVFLVALDTTILSTAIPRITDDFSSLKDVGWYGGVYSLTSSVFQLMFGKFYTVFSIKWTFLVSIVIFEAGSVLCAAAPVSEAFIIGRALAGVGSAGIFAGAFIVVAQTIPMQWRAIYTGIFGALYGVASVIGPLLGGLLTDKLSWRWCFWINLPVGVITVVIIWFCFNPKEDTESSVARTGSLKDRAIAITKLIDVPSTVILMTSTICLLLALQWGGVEYSWKNGRIAALLAVTGVSVLLFVAVQIKQKDSAYLPTRILRQRTVWACCWFSFSAGSSAVILIYYLPIWFQAVLATSALKSGLLNLPFVLSLVGASFIAGALVSFTGYYNPFLLLSSALRAVGAGLLTTLKPHSQAWEYILFQIIYGVGDGMGMQQPLVAVQNVLDAKDIPMGISVVIFTQTLGGAIFVAVGQSIFTDRLVTNIRNVNGDNSTSSIDPSQLVNAGATAFRALVKDETLLPHVVEAYNDALTKTFVISVVLACVSIFGAAAVEWKKVIPEKKRRQSVVNTSRTGPGLTVDSVPTEQAGGDTIELTTITQNKRE